MKASAVEFRYPDSAKHFMLFQIVALYVIQFAWWSQLCAFRQILNAFALEYRTVNISVFYINLGLMGLLSIVFAKVKTARKSHITHVRDKSIKL